MSDVVDASGSRFSPEAQSAVEAGLPNDDAFDALIGLVSMIEVVEGRRPHHAPFDPAWQGMEGWILGQEPEMSEGQRWLNRDAELDAAAAEQKLVARLRAEAAVLRALLDSCNDMWGYEDPVYRFYHQSFKVYGVQQKTLQIVQTLRGLSARPDLDHRFEQIVRAGTQKRFESEHNQRWAEVTRPILEAFFHARFFLEMAERYSHLEVPPRPLPSGYAALLCLYGLR